MDRQDKPPKPTDAELSILRVLWRRGPSTVRDVYDELRRERPMVYTTVLKLMQIMTEKGLVHREELGRAHLYRATQSEESAQRRLVEDLMDRAFGGSAQQLILHALSNRNASKEELAEIRRLLDDLEGKDT